MIDTYSISVLITTHNRPDYIHDVCAGWLEQPVDQVWLLDNSCRLSGEVAEFLDDDRFFLIPIPVDIKTRADYTFATATNGDLIICADDDVIPRGEFARDLFRSWKSMGGVGFHGIIGRRFTLDDYYQCPWVGAKKVGKPTRVGFTGVVYLAHRSLFGFDTRGMGVNCDDLWHQMKVYPDEPKWVVPTMNFQNTPDANNETAMFKDGELKMQRNRFYGEMYYKHYSDGKAATCG